MNKYKIDIWILLPVLLLMIFSIGVVYSASTAFALDKFQDSNYLFKQHVIKIIISIALIFIIARIDYIHLESIAKPLIWITIILLLFTLVSGKGPIKGASRWINLGPLSFQPSEFARYAIIIYVSLLLVKKKDYINLLYRGYLPVIFYILLIAGLILIQPNFSVASIIFFTCMIMLFISEAKRKHIIFTMLALLPFAVLFVLSKDYIMDRLTSYNEYNSSGNTSYQLQQALIGFGNGGVFGIGPGNSNQREFFLPEAHGDFIFSIIGEEYGFIGAFIILCLYFLIMVRGYKIAKDSKNGFGKYLAFGITTLIGLNAAVNMSVASGVIPTTGVTLPFVSYGGTSIIFTAAAIGVLLNISSQRDEIDEGLTIE
ncbi:MAG: putative lipid II flippase FtsW [Bacteroidota bacterium]|nr:putative lipid II flippase FtsW [Bacteroidota bacterium]